MKIQIASDLHTEFYRGDFRPLLETLDPTGIDVLVLAEAWVPVVIDTSGFGDVQYSIVENLVPFNGRIAVVTYGNSD